MAKIEDSLNSCKKENCDITNRFNNSLKPESARRIANDRTDTQNMKEAIDYFGKQHDERQRSPSEKYNR